MFTRKKLAGRVGAIFFVALLSVAMGHSSCEVHHHDDDEIHHGGGAPSVPPSGSATSWRLEHYEIERRETPGLHPIKAVRDIEGISMFDGAARRVDTGDLEEITAHIIEVNHDLLEVDRIAGTLTLDEVAYRDDGIDVIWRQEVEGDALRWSFSSGRLTFEFDLVGALRRIEFDLQAVPDEK